MQVINFVLLLYAEVEQLKFTIMENKKITDRKKMVEKLDYSKPNAETLEAYEEAMRLIHDPNARRFTNIDELFKYLDSDDED